MAVAVLPPHLGAESDGEAAYMGISMEDLPLVLLNPCREACKALVSFSSSHTLADKLALGHRILGVSYWGIQGSNNGDGTMTAFRMLLDEG